MSDPFEVTVEEDGALAAELAHREEQLTGRWPVPVTELVDPRPAFYRKLYRVPASPERQRRRSEGSEGHLRWVRRLAPPEQVEVRVSSPGLIGQVDLLEPAGPVELKTTGRSWGLEELRAERRGYLDQLGLYCALTDHPDGRLVVVSRGPSVGPVEVLAARARFDRLPELLQDGEGRSERFRRALRVRDPGELPRCVWRERGCEVGAAGLCGCTGAEPPDDRWVRDHLTELDVDPVETARWRAVVEGDGPVGANSVRSFRDLQFPRRAYFERTKPAVPSEGFVPDLVRELALRSLAAAVDAGPVGERGQRFAPAGVPPGSISSFRGEPFLVKVSAARPPADPVPASAVPEAYRIELGLRCSTLAAGAGWVFVRHLKATVPQRGIRAWRLTYRGLDRLHDELDRRRAGLEVALDRRDPTLAPACPSWRSRDCPYVERCGCAAGPS
jgi:hypothetical protein